MTHLSSGILWLLGANGCQYRTGSAQKRGASGVYVVSHMAVASDFFLFFCQQLFTFVSQSRFGVKVA